MPNEPPFAPEATPILEAIQQAHHLFHKTGSVGCPPFWDNFLHFQEEFDQLLATTCRLRSLEHLRLCETLEDLLGQVHARWEEIQKIRFCQALLELPPVRRRGMIGDLNRIDSRVLSEVLFLMPAWQVGQALAYPPAEATPWGKLVGLVLEDVKEQIRSEWPIERLGSCDSSETQQEALASYLREFCRMERPLRFPEEWIGQSCLDLRFEVMGRWELNERMVQHLLAWPEPSDITDAMAGLSTANRDVLLREMSVEASELAWTVVDSSRGLIQWTRVINAQRRLAGWMVFANLQ